MEIKYRSRKFIVTMICIAIATMMAMIGKLTMELSNVLLAAMASYNLVNGWVHRKDDAG